MINYEKIKGKENKEQLDGYLNELIEKNEQLKGKYKAGILSRLDKQTEAIKDFKENKISYEMMIKRIEINQIIQILGANTSFLLIKICFLFPKK